MNPIRIQNVLIALLCFLSIAAEAQTPGPSSNWVLTWSDEFNAPDGTPPDATKWTPATGGNGWGNNELEYYTASPRNAHQEHGSLVIEAIQEPYTGPDGVARNYTSARLKTSGKFSQAYGRFEARIKMPIGKGIWPAFWLLGDDIATVGWPKCGEIDIVENLGSEPSIAHGTIHRAWLFRRPWHRITLHAARWQTLQQRFSPLRSRVGAAGDSFLR